MPPEIVRYFDSLAQATVAAELVAKKAPVGDHRRRAIQIISGKVTFVDIPCPGSGKPPQSTFLEQIGFDPLAILVKGLCSASCGKDLTWNPQEERWETA